MKSKVWPANLLPAKESSRQNFPFKNEPHPCIVELEVV